MEQGHNKLVKHDSKDI